MTRNYIAIATALIAAPALFASAAEACISCEYVPEVVRSSSTLPHTGHYYSADAYSKKERSEPSRRVVKIAPIVKKIDTAERSEPKADKKIAKAAPAETAKVAKVESTETKAEPKVAQTENSSISLASTEAAAPEKAPVVEKNTKEAAAKPTDCKKFFPSVGMPVTVPCEQ
jgi:hypothetical protein